MFSRRSLPAILAIMALVGMVHAEDRVQSELKFVAHNKAEKTAGVWVDGQYVGFVKELTGDKKIVLLPGKHDVLVRQAWYKDYVEQVILEPGQDQPDQCLAGAGRAPEYPRGDRGIEDLGHTHPGRGLRGQSVRRARGRVRRSGQGDAAHPRPAQRPRRATRLFAV